MTDEIEKNLTTTESTEDYIATINELKKTTVPKEEFDKLKADNKRLLNSILTGDADSELPKKEVRPIEDIKKEIFHSGDINNLNYVKGVLELRDRIIESGKPDPFLPNSTQGYAITDQDIANAEQTAKVLKECVNFAGDDSLLFTNELQRRLV